jgi:hypothetical protein
MHPFDVFLKPPSFDHFVLFLESISNFSLEILTITLDEGYKSANIWLLDWAL